MQNNSKNLMKYISIFPNLLLNYINNNNRSNMLVIYF